MSFWRNRLPSHAWGFFFWKINPYFDLSLSPGLSMQGILYSYGLSSDTYISDLMTDWLHYNSFCLHWKHFSFSFIMHSASPPSFFAFFLRSRIAKFFYVILTYHYEQLELLWMNVFQAHEISLYIEFQPRGFTSNHPAGVDNAVDIQPQHRLQLARGDL